MNLPQKKRLGEILIENGILSSTHLEEALAHQKKEGGLIGQILIRLGYISEENLTAAIAKQLNTPYIPLSHYSVNMDAAQKLPPDYCRKNMIVLFDIDEKYVWIAVADPLNEALRDEVEKKTGLKAHIFISTPTEILNMLDIIHSSCSTKEIKKAG